MEADSSLIDELGNGTASSQRGIQRYVSRSEEQEKMRVQGKGLTDDDLADELVVADCEECQF